jgi:hypothetical protein
MAQTSVVVVTLTMLGTLGGLAYVHASRNTLASDDETKPGTAVPAATESVRSYVEAPSTPAASKPAEAPVQPPAAQQSATNDVAHWIAGVRSNDAKTRAAAIEALANAPKAQAIPTLERVLESGEPQIDRQIALRSLHTLALNDGDDTGAIRDAIRHAAYHGDDEGVTQSAQAFLEDIEAVLSERTERAP